MNDATTISSTFARIAGVKSYNHGQVSYIARQSLARLVNVYAETDSATKKVVVFYDGVLEMLESLSQKYSLGVITNGNADVNFIGIGRFFDFAISSEAAGVAKPHEDIFHQAIRLSKHPVENIVYIGDDPRCDVLGPQKIGMRALLYNPSLKPWPGGKTPEGVFRRHDELEDKIRNL